MYRQYLDILTVTAKCKSYQDSSRYPQSMTVLSRLIKQKTGYNFQELLQHRRFETAEHLLLETDLSVEEIALDVGYENQSYFFRQFKERYGMTPRKYRLEHYKR